MKKPALFFYQGEAYQSQGMGRFAKDILHVGEWVDPKTGQVVPIDRARLLRLARNTNKFQTRQDRQSLPFPDGHTLAAEKNLGWWNGNLTVIGDRLWHFVQPTAAGIAEKLENGTIRSVSPMIEFNRMDQQGEVYDEVITHICATPVPVTDGQLDFLKLSADGTDADLFIPTELAGTSPEGNRHRTEGHMDLKKLAKALGLPEDTPADKIMEAAEKAGQAATKLSAAAQQEVALATELKLNGFELKDGKVVKLAAPAPLDTTIKPTDAPDVVALKTALANQGQQLSTQGQALATIMEGNQKAHIAQAKAIAAELVKNGQVPPAMLADIEDLFAINGQVQALALSADGKPSAKAINPVETLKKVFTSLKSFMGTALSTLGAPAPDSAESKAAEAKATEVMKRLQPTAAGAGK
jgi:hypothetical protein